MNDLTEKQAEIWRFIRDYREVHKYSPSFLEIGAAIGVKGLNGVRDHLLALERKGWLKWEPKIARTCVPLRVIDGGKS